MGDISKTEEIRFVQFLPGFAIARTITEYDEDSSIGFSNAHDSFFVGQGSEDGTVPGKLYTVTVNFFCTNEECEDFASDDSFNKYFDVTVVKL